MSDSDPREQYQEHLAQLLQSSTFGGSERLKALLECLVKAELAGEEPPKEYELGTKVFHRPPEFDPQIDSIVRVNTSRLRHKLREYYEVEGAQSAVRFEIPKGARAIRLVGRPAAAPLSPLPAPRRRLLWSGLAAGGGLAALTLGSRMVPAIPWTPIAPRDDARLRFAEVWLPEGDIGAARFLADGRRALVSFRGRRDESHGQWIVDIATGAATRSALPPGIVCAVSDRDEVLMIATARPEPPGPLIRIALDGSARHEVAGDVWAADWTPDGGIVATIRLRSGWVLQHPPGNTIGSVDAARVRGFDMLRVAPDGRRVAFQGPAADNPEAAAVEVVELPASKPLARRVLFRRNEMPGQFTWSPDSHSLLVPRFNSSSPSVHRVPVSGQAAEAREITANLDSLALLDTGRHTGRVLAIASNIRYPLRGRLAASAGEVDLALGKVSRATGLSADGLTILAERPAGVHPSTEVVVRRFGDAAPPQVLGVGRASTLSADGRRVALVTPDDRPVVAVASVGGGPVSRHPIDLPRIDGLEWFPGSEELLVRNAGHNGRRGTYRYRLAERSLALVSDRDLSALVSPDGRYVVNHHGEQFEIRHLGTGTVAARLPRRFPSVDRAERALAWTASGDALYSRWLDDASTRLQILRTSLANGRKEVVWDIPAPDGLFALLPTCFITPDGRQYLYSYRQEPMKLCVIDGLNPA